MPEFSAAIGIKAAPARVFAFISKMENLPRILPTVEKAARTGADRILLKGASNGRRYALEARLRIDADARKISFEAPGCGEGALQLVERQGCVELAAAFDPEARGGPPEGCANAEASLRHVLSAVKEAIESRPDGERDDPHWSEPDDAPISPASDNAPGPFPPIPAARRKTVTTATWRPSQQGPQSCRVTLSPL
jgi:hypothetical protein